MTTINERVKMLRKSEELNKNEKMTLERFGARLGVTKVTISRIESGERNLTEQMFVSICREFDVNPDWLRAGIGEMFVVKNRNEEISAFFDRVLRDEPDAFRARLIAALARLDDSQWARVAEVAQSIVADVDPEEAERARMHAELDRQLDEEKNMASSASDAIN